MRPTWLTGHAHAHKCANLSNTKFLTDIIFLRERGEWNETDKPQAASLLATLITRREMMRMEIMRKDNWCDLHPKLRISMRNSINTQLWVCTNVRTK